MSVVNGIVGDLRLGRRDARDERRLAGVGKADEPDVGEQLQLQPKLSLLARLARLRLARRAIGRRREVRVAEAAASALGDEHALADVGQIGELRRATSGMLRIAHEDERADRHGDLEVVAVAPGLERALAAAAALGVELRGEAEVNERVAVRIGDEIDRAALAAVAAIGTAARDELLAAEAERAAAAVAGLDVDVDFVDEHRVRIRTRIR